jgi:hypothetical protein
VSLSPKRYFLNAPKEQPGTCFVLNSDYEALMNELLHTRKFCRECGGSGKAITWDVNSGPPTDKCECRKPRVEEGK